MGAEPVFVVIPFKPRPAFEAGQLAAGPGYAERAQYLPHAGAGHFAHAQKNKFVAVGNQHGNGP